MMGRAVPAQRRCRGLALSVGVFLAALIAPAVRADDKLLLTGSSTVAPLAAEIAKRYESLHPGVRVDVQMGGSARGVTDIRHGLADIGMVSRALKADEADLTAYTIAFDGVTMIVNKVNPITTLTEEQIVAIYTGKIREWSAVGPGKGQIVIENKAEGRSTLELFLDHFKLSSPEIKADVVVGDNEEALKFVSVSPNALGYVSIGGAVYAADSGVPIKALPLDGVEPTIEAVATRKFPILRELNLVLARPPEGRVKDFINYAQSGEVYDLVKELFYVPIR